MPNFPNAVLFGWFPQQPRDGGEPESALNRPVHTGEVHTGTVHTGTGALLGQQVSVPVASDSAQPADEECLPPAVKQVLKQSDEVLLEQMQAQSTPVLLPGSLFVPQPGTLATNQEVISRLVAHAEGAKTLLNPQEIVGYVALGERAVRAIVNPSDAPAPLQVEGYTLTPNLEVMRAIAWYVAACAAQQDVNQQALGEARALGGQEITDLSICGAYVLNDPGNALYQFMGSCPLVYARISTHFNERSDSGHNAYGKADQRGIEDYRRRLPGENGTILFDKLKDGDKKQIFFKFESAGMPTAMSAYAKDDQGEGLPSWQQVAERLAWHSLSFIGTLLYTAPGVERKEHVHKGLLQELVCTPFLGLAQQAQALGLLSAGSHASEVKEQGLPYVEQTLQQIHEAIKEKDVTAPEMEEFLRLLHELHATISQSKEQLGAQTNHLEITRRGAETHVDLNTPRVHLQQAHEGFVRWKDTAIKVQDWHLQGIQIGDVFYADPALTEETAYAKLLEICGGHADAAGWISRFARQDQAGPLVEYLRKESLGTMGSGLQLMAGQWRCTIEPLADGVDLRWDFLCEKRGDAPLEIRQEGGPSRKMDDEARLQASVTLRFEGLSRFETGNVPVPEIIKPLTYSLSNFKQAIEEDYVMIEADPDEPAAPQVTAWRW